MLSTAPREALETISPARRRQLHRTVADAITALQGDRTDAVSPRLAAHYDQAGMIEPAIDAYRTAGARAVAVSAFDEAVTLFRRALTLLADLPASTERDRLELDLRISLGSPLVALEGYGSGSAHQLYERARALCPILVLMMHRVSSRCSRKGSSWGAWKSRRRRTPRVPCEVFKEGTSSERLDKPQSWSFFST